MSELPASLTLADHVIVSKIFASRETDPGDFSGADIAAVCHGCYISEFADIVQTVKKEVKNGDIVLVMGSGDSYKLARQILDSL